MLFQTDGAFLKMISNSIPDTNMDNGKSDTEGNTDADKQELKDNFNDLDFVKIPPHLKGII